MCSSGGVPLGGAGVEGGALPSEVRVVLTYWWSLSRSSFLFTCEGERERDGARGETHNNSRNRKGEERQKESHKERRKEGQKDRKRDRDTEMHNSRSRIGERRNKDKKEGWKENKDYHMKQRTTVTCHLWHVT